jgi:serine-type D-Ala-D-Ala carboxypeptidase (penicillin-binding protein 5/6)
MGEIIQMMLSLRFSVLFALFLIPLAFFPAVAQNNDPGLSYICINAESGSVIFEENADLRRPPASMVKMMLLLLVSEGMDAGLVTGDYMLGVSRQAQNMGGTQVYLEEGESWPLDLLMKAIAIASANDAAMCIAEGLWGSKEECLEAMNHRAIELGMRDTVFNSVHGLPPSPGDDPDLTTARDMARLAIECVKHPRILDWVSQKELIFKPDHSTYYNTNKLLWRMEDSDGLKTGYIRAAGFCVTATVQREGLRLVSVVMGAPTVNSRFNLAAELLEDGFAAIHGVPVIGAGTPIGKTFSIPGTEAEQVRLETAEEIRLAIRPGDREKVQLEVRLMEPFHLPIASGEWAGDIIASLDGRKLGRFRAVTPIDLAPPGWRLMMRQGVFRWEGLDKSTPLQSQ